ncbi:UDP-2,4-diacetamido-2,4,6-trideoxy-beta-L-altropyranose hydrolase [Salinimicrobium terrae]|uniref:UDP-2,4-diacetamido-2,4, 6-trideoxy-beta-L-altropyranose hydrolase n=1 Tax=Salinimicrobium terrae TaxID=470866 RepID=UPI00048F1F3B|nr:UDP-2,4-diacetamido-2,4,6-trideoxy-beta-L-altropyranose hydrolase [Salinimicrobium terrae]
MAMDANKKNIFFRADGSTEIGLGHIVRCIALAHMLKKNFSINFASKEIPENLKKQIKENGFLLNVISSEEDFFSLLSGQEIVVLDHYELDSDYQKRVKNLGCKLVCIDDLHEKEFFADLIINHSPGIVPQDYRAQEYTKFALGPQYALLRPIFIQAAGLEKEIREVNNVMICFGGSDNKNLTKPILEVVQTNKKIKTITVILGSAYPYRSSIDAIVGNNSRIRVLSSLNEKEMLAEIEGADLAIIPSSGILFEVIAGGCIPLICYYAENQKKLFTYFKESRKIPSFNALKFDKNELDSAISDIVNKKIQMREIPLRKKIGQSYVNNLHKFMELIA